MMGEDLGAVDERIDLDLDAANCEVRECNPPNPKNSRMIDASTTMTPVPGPLVRIKSG